MSSSVSPSTVVLSYGDYVIRKVDMKILHSKDWLNDTLMGFYLQWLLETDADLVNGNLCKFVGPEVTQLLKLVSPDQVESVLEELVSDIQYKFQYVFLPVNDCCDPNLPSGGSHWSLLVFSKVDNSFIHFDSTVNNSNECQAKILAETLLPFTSAASFTNAHCQKQVNGYDCGFHVICNIRVISNYLKTGSEKKSLLLPECPTVNHRDASAMRLELLNLISTLSETTK